MKLVDIDIIRTEIENRIDRCNTKKWSCPANTQVEAICDNKIYAYKEILSFIYTTEVKNVDLEKELDTWRHNHFHGRRDKDANGEYLERSSQLDIAEYFFNLGLISQLSWKDVKRLIEIGDMLLNDTGASKLFEEEYYTEILKNFKKVNR